MQYDAALMPNMDQCCNTGLLLGGGKAGCETADGCNHDAHSEEPLASVSSPRLQTVVLKAVDIKAIHNMIMYTVTWVFTLDTTRFLEKRFCVHVDI